MASPNSVTNQLQRTLGSDAAEVGRGGGSRAGRRRSSLILVRITLKPNSNPTSTISDCNVAPRGLAAAEKLPSERPHWHPREDQKIMQESTQSKGKMGCDRRIQDCRKRP